MAASAGCPANSFSYNGTLCTCNPGYVLDAGGGNCSLFRVSPGEWAVSTGVDYALKFPATIFSFDSIRKLTNPQAVFLEATLFTLVCWLVFCFSVRLGKVEGGKSLWFTLRWWISRLDFVYPTQHWLDDQKVMKKRKTELGGTFSVASWILFIGLLAALLYQIIAKRRVEVHNVRPTNAPDLATFINDMEFNITTISSMSCSHLRGLDTVVTGTPGSVDHRVSPLVSIVNTSCYNTSRGPTVTLRCNSCKIPRDSYYISWQFVDLPNNPAMAVAFQFNLTAKPHGHNDHVSFVSGALKNGTNDVERPNTFRGRDANILQFHLFPRLYRNFHDLKLIQPLFHGFIPGSSLLETSQLQSSLQNSQDGLINTTVQVNFLCDYIVEINSQNALGPVGFLADVGGLYAFCMAIFLYSLLQFEHRIKKLRKEDQVMRNIRSQRRAQLHWDKLRKYVMYTFGVHQLEERSNRPMSNNWMTGPLSGLGSLHKRKPSREDSIYLDKSSTTETKTNMLPKAVQIQEVQLCFEDPTTNRHTSWPPSRYDKVLENDKKKENCSPSVEEDKAQSHVGHAHSNSFQLPPIPEMNFTSGADISLLQKNFQDLHEYNVHLRERLAATESLLQSLSAKASFPSNT